MSSALPTSTPPLVLPGAAPEAAAPRRTTRLPAWLVGPTWPVAAVLGLVALAIRAVGLARANDLFIDELTYAEIANNVADGRLPQQFGEPFFLHPIGSFLINGLVIRVLGLTGSFMDLVYPLRWVNTVLGAVTVVLAVYLVRALTRGPAGDGPGDGTAPRRTGGLVPAAIAGVVLAFDPFVLRQDGRVMIETPATLWVVAGWLVLVTAGGAGTSDAATPPVRTRRALAAGVLFGLAVVSKDLTAVSTVLPLVLAASWRRTLPWATVRRVLFAVPAPYVVYLAVIAANGLLPAWFSAKVGGVLRLVGIDQETGFNAVPGASLTARLVEMVTRFGTSYVLLGLGMFAGIAAAFSAVPVRRLVGLFAATTGALGIYCVVVGAAEEQFGYYVVITSVLALAALWAELVDRAPRWRRPAAALALVFTVLTVVLGVSARMIVDDAMPRARGYLTTLPAGSRVGLTDVLGEFALLPHAGWRVWPSLTSLHDNDAQYVLTRSHQLDQGYGYAAPALLDWLHHNATPVFVAAGPSGGDTVVWRLDPRALDAAVAAGQTLPPISGDYS